MGPAPPRARLGLVGPGRARSRAGRTLAARQEQELQKLSVDQRPDQLKWPFARWTRRAVAQLIAARYGRKLPVRTLGEYLPALRLYSPP